MVETLQLTEDKKAQRCWGCGIYASCEPLKYTNGKQLMLCGNCMSFCKQYGKQLIKNHVTHQEIRHILEWWRENKGDKTNAIKKIKR